MLICVSCGRVITYVNERIKYTSCPSCLFGESDYIPADELIYPPTEAR